MANSNNTLQTPVQNWRDKYLALTEEQDALKQQHRKLVALLSRGVLRLSVLSDGLDDRLDACLGGLRRALRNQSTTLEQLTEIIDTLDGRIKVIAEKKSSRPVQLVKLLRVLVDQLRRITVQDSTLAKIKQFEQKLKHDDSSEHIASALNEMIQVQAAVFADIQSGIKPSPPFWARWFSSAEVLSDNKNKNTAEKSSHSSDLHANASLPECESMFASDLEMDTENNVNSMHDQQVMHDYAKDIAGREEPPFATINPAICLVLDELIRQIEPPLTAKENYLEARRLLNKGLNWFELVPLLENLSLVVVSAIDSSQKEFETYLNLLNERLQQAAEVLLQSDQANGERQQASLALQDSVNNTLDDLRKDVVETHDLDTLKAQVNNRIEAIVGAMSAFESAEKSHKISLGDQLNALAEKVREMEAQSKQAEIRIEEQRHLALRDVLTQLPNREAYNQRLDQELDRWQRYQRPMVLAVADVDHFKRINDGFGHLAGDKVLRVIAKILRKRLRKTDFVARYGGEEFIVLLPETTMEQAIPVLDSVRQAIANCPFHFRETPVSITMSFGVSAPGKDETSGALFERADKALYAAKNSGRNCLRQA